MNGTNMTKTIMMKLSAIRPSDRKTVAKSLVMLLALFALPVAISGCGHSGSQSSSSLPDSISGAVKLCTAIAGTGLTNRCEANASGNTLDVTIGSNDDEEARKRCAVIAGKLTQQTANLSGLWKLQVFSPYRSDKPLAVCSLH